MKGPTSSQCAAILKEQFGPTCRLATVHRGGLEGVRVVVGWGRAERVLSQTFTGPLDLRATALALKGCVR